MRSVHLDAWMMNLDALRFCAGIGTEHVAHPQGEARILVIEKAGEYLKIKSVVGVKHF